MVVDQAGNDCPAAGIDAPRVRPGQPRDRLVGAHRDDAVAPHRHRLRDREPLVNRDDLSVGDDEVGGRLLRQEAGRQCEDKEPGP